MTYTLGALISPAAKNAEQWEAAGNTFEPDAQIIIGHDFDSQRAAYVMLEKFGRHVLAVQASMSLANSVVVELIFGMTPESPVLFYNRLPKNMKTYRDRSAR